MDDHSVEPVVSGPIPKRTQLDLGLVTGMAGFAAFFAWVFAAYASPVLLPPGIGAPEAGVLRLSMMAASVVALAATWGFSKRLSSRRGMLVLLVAAVVLGPMCAWPALIGGLPQWAETLAWVLTGLGYVPLLALCGVFLSTLNHKQALLYPPVAIGLAAVFCVAMAVFKEGPATVVAMFLPVLSAGLFVAAQAGLGLTADPYDAVRSGRSLRFAGLWRSIAATFAYSLCLGFTLYCLTLQGGWGYGLLVAGAVVVATSVLIAVDALTGQRIDEALSLKIAAPSAAIGLLPMLFVGPQGRLVCCWFLAAACVTMGTVNWSAVSELTRVFRLAPIAVFSYGRIGNMLGLGAGYALGLLALADGRTGGFVVPAVPAAIVVFLVLLQAFVFRENYPYAPQSPHHAPEGDHREGEGGAWRRRCERFAEYYRLSPRQTEVLILLAKGRNAEYVQEKLFISNHTARAHIYNIYRKTDVHSQSELMDRIEAFDMPDGKPGAR